MRQILTVTVPATDQALTTLARIKLELNITDTSGDALLEDKIDEVSSLIEANLCFRVPRETVSETFWHDETGLGELPSRLVLERFPVASITSVTVDGNAIDSSLYSLDAKTGQLYALDTQGFPCGWYFCKSIVVVYVAGYILPAESNSDLPAGIQSAAIDLLSLYWQSRGRDPTIKAEEILGVIKWDYWVGDIGEPGELPPSVVTKLAPFRRVVV